MEFRQEKIVQQLLSMYTNTPKSINPSWVIGQLQQILEIERTTVSAVWSVEDVYTCAQQFPIPLELSEQESIEILQMMDAEHDSEYGFTWQVLENTIHWYLEQHKPEVYVELKTALGY